MASVDEWLESADHPCSPVVVDVAVGSAQDLLGCCDLIGACHHVEFDGERSEHLCLAHLSHSDGELEGFSTSGEI